jgi:hypothetical protein
MSFGTRFRLQSEAHSLRNTMGAALAGMLLLGGTAGMTVAQEASPAASPVASVSWAVQVPVEADVVFDGDRASVGVVLSAEETTINVASIETRPYIILQTDNQTDAVHNAVLFMVPEGFDATTFTFPASEADLPEGVTAIGGYAVEPGSQTAAVFEGLEVGSYLLATDGGLMVPFAVVEAAELDVPDIFAEPAGTPAG